ncbi:N-acetylmuramoyl-L-alanine amidase [Thermodesulfobacteriota bacterium]
MSSLSKIYFLKFLMSLVLICVFLVPLTIECEAKTKADILIEEANACRNSLYRSTKKMNYRHNWENCFKKYKAVYEKYPESSQAAWAIFRSAKMYEKLNKYSGLEKDLDKALELYEKVTQEHSKHSLADDSQYEMGNIYYTYKKDIPQAYVEYLKVDIKYPSGDMRPKAKKMMDKLSVMLEEKNRKENPDKKNINSKDELTIVKNIRHLSSPTYTRVVIDLDGPVEYKAHLLKKDPDLKKPRRLYLDLEKTRVGSDIDDNIPIKDGLLKAARAGQYKPDTVRVVLDIDSIGGYKIFRLHDPFRVVVDVNADKTRISENNKVTRKAGKGVLKPKRPDDNVSLARQLGLSVKRIVIDPGHGGRDPGCIFKGGIEEKDITLDIAKRLKKKIEKEMECEVFLTRTKDVSMPLDERTAFANIKKADLFISLHVNAHKQEKIYGVETYFLNMATDKRAVMVAARENATSEKNISDLQSILNDLMLNTKISESSKLAYQVQDGIMGDIKKSYRTYKSLGVKQAPFYVLIGAKMPAVLVETGFITNSTERKRLQSSKYKEMLAQGIVSGIKSYVKSIDQVYAGG